MAVQQYGSGPYRPYQSTASNQNTAARQLPIGDGAGPQAQNSWQATTTNLPTNNGNNSQYNPWGTNARAGGGTGPYNPNPPAQQPQTGYTPTQLSPWQQQTPTAPQMTPGQQSTPQTWATPQAWTPANFNTPALQSQNSAYMSTVLPYLQYQQNNSQYSQDFNEAQRRWDSQNGWQQQMDQYNMGLTGRQQNFNEWQAQEAANQWGAQFGWTQQNDLFSQGLAQRQQAIDQAYNEGRLTNEQRQIALGEVTQAQNYAFQQQQLAAQQGWNREELAANMGWNREQLASTDAYRQQQDQLARWQQQQQMQQQTAMQQAELAAARQNAVLQATGRSMGNGPSATWMKRF